MSNTLDILDCKGARVGEYVIPEGVIELEKGEQAVHDTVVAYLAGQRAGSLFPIPETSNHRRTPDPRA